MNKSTDKTILQHNEKLLNDFIQNKIHRDGINKISQKTIAHTLIPFIKYNKKPIDFFNTITEQQIYQFIEQYSLTSRRVVINRIKELCRFIHKLDEDDKLPSSLRRIKPPTKKQIDKETPPNIEHKIITSDEYNLLITKGSSHPMDKALLETMYLFGCRPSELISMNWNHVKEDPNTGITTITVPHSKTKPREIPTTQYPKYLLDWVNVYCPNMNKEDEPLWVNRSYKNRDARIQEYTVFSIIKTMSKHAGITRNIHPYMLRHTCITRDSANGMLRTHIESKHGWVKGTPMLKVYDHNGTEDLKKYLTENIKGDKPETFTSLKKEKETMEKTLSQEIDRLKKENIMAKTVFKKLITQLAENGMTLHFEEEH
ncbi:Tyrosine recombinase XerC [uncultured archaeon]|nr:Tyrosine recombinase XerC [uncultured archaeon]